MIQLGNGVLLHKNPLLYNTIKYNTPSTPVLLSHIQALKLRSSSFLTSPYDLCMHFFIIQVTFTTTIL